MESNLQQVSRLIDELGEAMSKTDWAEFLEEIITDCEGKLEAVREELEHGDA